MWAKAKLISLILDSKCWGTILQFAFRKLQHEHGKVNEQHICSTFNVSKCCPGSKLMSGAVPIPAQDESSLDVKRFLHPHCWVDMRVMKGFYKQLQTLLR